MSEPAAPGDDAAPATRAAEGGGAAPARPTKRVVAQAGFEASVLLRNGEQLLLTMVLPALLMIGLARTSVVDLGDEARRLDLVVPGVLALAVMSTAFTGQAIGTAFDRRYGVLRMLATTPLGHGGLLAGKVLAVGLVIALQAVLLGGLGLIMGWQPTLTGVLPALLTAVVGAAAFTGLGLLLAGTVRAEGVLAGANLVWVLLVAGGGVVVPTSSLPGALAQVAPWLPSGALGDGLRAALVDGELAVVPLLVLAAWAAAAAAGIRRWFSWG